MNNQDGKPVTQPDKSRIVPMAIIFVVLCGSSFYMGIIFCSEKDRFLSIYSEKSIESHKESSIIPLQIKYISYPECSIDFQDYTPCTDPRVKLLIIVFFLMYRTYRRMFPYWLSMLKFSEMEEVHLISAYFVGTPLPSKIGEERLLSSSPGWI